VVSELEVVLQQLDDGRIGCGLAVGDRRRFQDEPADGAMRLSELPVETRLADPGLAHDRHHLSMPLPRQGERLDELLYFDAATHEFRQAPSRGGLKAGARHSCSAQLVDLDGLLETFHVPRAECLHADVALDEVQR
jgi:hypothetical protein